MSINGHSKGKGPLKLYEENDRGQKKYHQEKIGLMVGGYVLAKSEQDSEWHLAQVTESLPLKSKRLCEDSAGGPVPRAQ